jgi:7,8-dihydropterin-6-yl-methyl-4-(beta-D-ribofuranosyl)aminobenzene 5'-phosphate synthase
MSDYQGAAVQRRGVLCGGSAAILSGGAKPVRPEAISGPVPEIDHIAGRVVADSYQFAVAPSRKAANTKIDHFGWGISADKPPGRTLISEFGLSLHIE